MCIIVLNEKNQIKKDVLKNCWINNDDGGGFGYIDKGKLSIYHELENFEHFYTKYKQVRKKTDRPILLHFRIATSGKVDLVNAHPFYVNQNLLFAHNGIFHGFGSATHSDTFLFNERILKKLPKNFIFNDGINALLEAFCDFSKLVFLDNLGNYKIINEEQGYWEGNDWFSNSTYFPLTYGIINDNYCLLCGNLTDKENSLCEYCEKYEHECKLAGIVP